MPSQTVVACTKVLLDKELTLAFAESATAGRLSSEFSLIPNCGKTLRGGLVCYDAGVKLDILGVPKEVVEKYTPESAEVTKELAERMQSFLPADIQVAVTGLTMPGGSETEDKPVGTMFIHAIISGKSIALREVYKGSPEEIVLQTVERVAQLLINELS
jgi:nicotinamide-nucleotide amidase